jgi:tetratricopeptide (TPR) repeat protein
VPEILTEASKLVCIVLISFMSVAVGYAQKQKVPVESEPVKRARLLVAKGDLAAAIAIYDEAIKVNPARAEMYVKRGIAFRLQGALDKAIQDFDKATDLEPAVLGNDRAVADAYGNHGQILLSNLRPEDAIVAFEKALRIYPANPRPYFDRAEARILVEDFAGAIEDINTYLTSDRWDPFSRGLALADRSLAKHLLGRDDEAKKDLESIPNISEELKEGMLKHIGMLEAQLMILRHLRSQQKKVIA